MQEIGSGTKILFNGTNLESIGNLKILSYNLSTPVKKTETREVPGQNGDIDLSYTVFKYPRFHNRMFTINMLIHERTRERAIDVVNQICSFFNVIEKIKINVENEATFYLEGRLESEFNLEQFRLGTWQCGLQIICYPLFKKDFNSIQLWDQINFETDFFQDMEFSISSNQTILILLPIGFEIGKMIINVDRSCTVQHLNSIRNLVFGDNAVIGAFRGDVALEFVVTATTKVKIRYTIEELRYV